jgi:hypothetical protein
MLKRKIAFAGNEHQQVNAIPKVLTEFASTICLKTGSQDQDRLVQTLSSSYSQFGKITT